MDDRFNTPTDIDFENLRILMHNFASIGELCNDMVNSFYYNNFKGFSVKDVEDAVDFIKAKVNNFDEIMNKIVEKS